MAIYIGVDIGKKNLQLYLPAIDKSFELTNNEAGFNKMLNLIGQHYNSLSSVIVVFEPTGGYERSLRAYLKTSKINFATVHPNKVRSYAKAKGWLAKTDHIDSKLLADYATVFSLPIKQVYDCEAQKKLHKLIRRREQLLFARNQEQNRLETEDDKLITGSIKKHVKHIDQQLKVVEKAIVELCANDQILRDKMAKLTSIPGVGSVVATTAICQLPELGCIEQAQVTALVGLAPYARESGSYKGRRAVFGGRGNLRKALYMAAVASLRCNKKLKAFYDRLIANHKPPKVALTALMRKLLGFMHALLKNNTFWNENYVNF